jgi:hypothetical protein
MKQLYVIYFESANYCGAGEHCVVWASSPEEAETKADYYMQDYYYDQDYEQFAEENDGEEPDTYYNVVSVELLSESDQLEFYNDPAQRAAFYPCVNEEDSPE